MTTHTNPVDTQLRARDLVRGLRCRAPLASPARRGRSSLATTSRRRSPRSSRLSAARCRTHRLRLRQQLDRRHRERSPPAAGAIVRREPLQGKGNVVRRMFADIEADVYVLVDGDGTYDAASATRMVELLLARSLDMVNGARVATTEHAYRPGHRLGNTLLTGTVALMFGNRIRDMLSGYRVFSRRFVKSFPALSRGLRDRDRAHRARARAADADRRGRHALPRAAGRLAEQAAHVPRRLAHPAHDRAARQGGAAAAVLLERRRSSWR